MFDLMILGIGVLCAGASFDLYQDFKRRHDGELR